MVLANIFWLSVWGFTSAVAAFLAITAYKLRAAVKKKSAENLQLHEECFKAKALLEEKKQANAKLPENLLEKNPAQTGEPTSSNKDDKYRKLYYKLDTHIQKFSDEANNCLKELAEQLRSASISGEIKSNLADLAVYLKRLNPLLNTDNIQTTIYGEPKESPSEEEGKEQDSNARGLRNVIIQQRNIIMDLKKQLAEVGTGDCQLYEQTLAQLETLLKDSEEKTRALEKELIATQSQLETKAIQTERTKFLQNRVAELESKESHLMKEILELKNECLKHSYSSEKEQLMSKTIGELKNAVEDREIELSKYKKNTDAIESEYTRLFDNYQSILEKYNIKDGDDMALEKLTPEQMLEVEEIKAILNTKEYELERAKSECQLLETSYLELVENSDHIQDAKEELDRLRIENKTLGDQLQQSMEAKHSRDELSKELSELKEKYTQLKHNIDLNQDEITRLRKKEEELKHLRIEYSMMEEQFIAVASAAME